MLSHGVLLGIILIVALGANARKNIDYNFYKHFLYPFLVGAFFYGSSIIVIQKYRWLEPGVFLWINLSVWRGNTACCLC